jgi:tetratricopeptide (TPR) repeat protein
MSNRLLSACAAFCLVAALSSQAFAEGVNERRERKAKEAQKYPSQASEALQKNNPDLAIELFNKSLSSGAFNSQPQMLGEIHFGLGDAYNMKKDCPAAIQEYDKAAETIERGTLFFNRAICKLSLGQEDKALSDIDLAIKADPEASSYRKARCIVLFNRKDFAGALPDCEKALVATPSETTLLTAASQAAEQSGNRPRAIELYRRLLAAEPGNAVATEGLKRLGG